jgi:hypothetical protein
VTDGFGEIGGRCQDDVEIDDMFGGKPWNGGTADVFDGYCQVSQSGL